MLSGLAELPFGKGRRFLSDASGVTQAILGGWQINANATIMSGLPFNLDYRDASADRDQAPNRPNLIGDAQIGSGDGITSPYFNATPIGSPGSAFGRPARATFGDLPRNAFTGPGFWNVDASLFKKFGIGRTELELRVEAQNVFNHVNLNNPDGNIGVPGNTTRTPVSSRAPHRTGSRGRCSSLSG